MKITKIKPVFVPVIPKELEDGVLYICLQYKTAIHKCACGCNEEVVTPLAPDGWRLSYHGTGVSLYPSIGNWSYPCRSHYWIIENRIVWAATWSDKQIQRARKQNSKRMSRGTNL